MARIKQANSRTCKMWAKNWSKTPRLEIPVTCLKELLVYFPKTPKAFNLIHYSVLDPYSSPKELAEKKKILSKYRKFLHSSLTMTNSRQVPAFCDIPSSFTFLKRRFQGKNIEGDTQIIEGVNLRGKRIRHAEISIRSPFLIFSNFIQEFKKIITLKSLNTHPLSFANNQRLLFASKSTLQHITFQGPVSKDFPSHKLIGLMIAAVQLQNLKSLRFDAECPDKFNANRIPFNILQKRNINFDIRVTHFADTPLSKETLELLWNLDYLSINNQELVLPMGETPLEEKAQEGLSRLFFLNIAFQKKFNSEELFKACKNISTLHLILDGKIHLSLCFDSLKNLQNLQNLIICLKAETSPFQALFDNLTEQSLKYQTLKSFTLKLDVENWSLDLTPFFEACRDTVQHFDFQVLNSQILLEYYDLFYTSLGKLQKLTSLFFLIRQLSGDSQNGFLYFTNDFLSLIKNQSQLEKLSITLSFPINFGSEGQVLLQLPPSMTEFELSFRCDLSVLNIETLFGQASGIKTLSLDARINPSSLEKLLSCLRRLQELETLNLFELQPSKEQLHELQIQIPNLQKLIVFDGSFRKRMGLWKEFDEVWV